MNHRRHGKKKKGPRNRRICTNEDDRGMRYEWSVIDEILPSIFSLNLKFEVFEISNLKTLLARAALPDRDHHVRIGVQPIQRLEQQQA